ncbi:hypothetical protein F5Y19DRAFT_426035 [Xylariaceae sp. FL1651]|nr:hypothetical protein F5Y19DRAFT_426035 [Xylariaceae sp. FL1651]
MVTAFEQRRNHFNSLSKGVDKLEAISNATEITVIPRTLPRRRSGRCGNKPITNCLPLTYNTIDRPGWLYLLDLDQETLEIYEFRDYKPPKHFPFSRLTTESLYKDSPNEAPGYYIKLTLSELQAMWRSDWVAIHEAHADALSRLWIRNRMVLQTIPHADSIPFSVLYGSVFYGKSEDGTKARKSTRLTQARLTKAMAALNSRQSSRLSIWQREPRKARTLRRNSLQDL